MKQKNENNYDLLIRQSYHGTGSHEGYKFKVYNNKREKLGELKEFSPYYNNGDVVELEGQLYEIMCSYDSPHKREERSEVIYYELNKYVFKPKGYLELKKAEAVKS